MNPVFSLLKPRHPLPVIFDSPHSGRDYPADFGHACDFDTLRTAEDHYVDELLKDAPAQGITVLAALFPRSYIDVNRREDDIDPLLLDAPWPHGAVNPSSRSDAGIGLIRRLIKPGMAIYAQCLNPTDITHRIENYYRPYHTALAELSARLHDDFGQVWHVNCHAMPAATAYPKRALSIAGLNPHMADIVLGDRDGTTCAPDFTHFVRDFFTARGYHVTLNDPFRGVEILRRYGNPARGMHSLQIEINKALYMDEKTQEKTADYALLKADLDAFAAACADYAQSRLTRLAAD